MSRAKGLKDVLFAVAMAKTPLQHSVKSGHVISAVKSLWIAHCSLSLPIWPRQLKHDNSLSSPIYPGNLNTMT